MSNSSSGLGIRIAQIPSSVQEDPFSNVYIVAHLKPSSTFSQRIEVSNTTTAPMKVLIYPGAATNANDVFLTEPAGSKNSLTSWTTVFPNHVTIGAQGTVSVIVTIKVPSSAALGSNYGVVWASVSSSPNMAGVISVNRVGIRMYDPVGNESAQSTTTSSHATPWWPEHAGEIWAIGFALIAVILIGYLYSQTYEMKKYRKNLRKQRKKRLKELRRS